MRTNNALRPQAPTTRVMKSLFIGHLPTSCRGADDSISSLPRIHAGQTRLTISNCVLASG